MRLKFHQYFSEDGENRATRLCFNCFYLFYGSLRMDLSPMMACTFTLHTEVHSLWFHKIGGVGVNTEVQCISLTHSSCQGTLLTGGPQSAEPWRQRMLIAATLFAPFAAELKHLWWFHCLASFSTTSGCWARTTVCAPQGSQQEMEV